MTIGHPLAILFLVSCIIIISYQFINCNKQTHNFVCTVDSDQHFVTCCRSNTRWYIEVTCEITRVEKILINETIILFLCVYTTRFYESCYFVWFITPFIGYFEEMCTEPTFHWPLRLIRIVVKTKRRF